MDHVQRDIESLFDAESEGIISRRYGTDDETRIIDLVSTEYTFFKLDEPECDMAAIVSASGASEIFLRAARQGDRGIAAAVAGLTPAAWSWNQVDTLSGRTKDIANGLARRQKVLLSPFTGTLAYTDLSLGREWYLVRDAARYCLASQIGGTMGSVHQETLWVFPQSKTILYVSNYHTVGQLNQIIAQLLLRCLSHFLELRTYLSCGTPRTLALSDFSCPHLGHYIWNLMSGWANIFGNAQPDAVDRLLVHGGQAFFGALSEVFPEDVKPKVVDTVGNDDDIFALMLKNNALLFCIKDENISEDLAQRLIRRAYQQCTPEFLSAARHIRGRASPFVLITIRLDNRSWIEQELGWVSLFRRLKHDFPDIGVAIYGLSGDTPKGWTTAWMSLEAEEKLASAIEGQLSSEIPTINCVGGTLAESIVLADMVDAFVAPSGSGMALYKWIANKPGIAFSNSFVLDENNPIGWTFRVFDHFRSGIIEARYLAADCVQDVEENNHGEITRRNFRMDWRDLHDLTHNVLVELFPQTYKRSAGAAFGSLARTHSEADAVPSGSGHENS